MLEKIQNLPLSRRIFIYALLPVIGLFLFWNSFYSPSSAEIKNLKTNLLQARRKLASLKLDQKKLEQLNKEIKEVEKKFYEVERLLPTEREIPGLLRSVSSLGNDAHLDFLLFEPKKEVAKNFYVEVPILVKVEGEYLNVESFLEKLSELPRIINVSQLKLSSPKMEGNTLRLKAEMQIVTYRFLPKSKESSKKGGNQGRNK